MTNEEAKAQYTEAVSQVERGNFADALGLLDALDAARPNSRHVTYQRALCLVPLGRIAEAEACLQGLDGKVDQPRIARLEALIAAAQTESEASGHALPHAEPGEGGTFSAEAAYPVDADRALVTGRVRRGTIRLGDVALVTTPDGIEVEAPVLRIGPEETPANVVRGGQATSLLLEIEPQYISAGMSIEIASRAEAYAATMVVESKPAAPREAAELPAPVAVAARQMRQGELPEAIAGLQQAVEENPDLASAHSLLARAYLESVPPVRNPERALEHVRRAYELDSSEDSEVNGLLAWALAETGEAEHGLRFLERLYKKTSDPAEQTALAARIGEFRSRYGLGSLWQFADQFGEIVFEAQTMPEIVKALQRGVIPKDAKCRFNRISEWRPVDAALSGADPQIAAVFGEAATGWSAWPVLIAAAGAAAIAAAAAVFLF